MGQTEEVSTHWVAKQFKVHVRTVRRWIHEKRFVYVRAEYGAPLGGGRRHIKWYYLLRSEVETLLLTGAQHPSDLKNGEHG